MSAFEAPAFNAIAFQLAAALEEYEQAVQRMVDHWFDTDLYRVVSEHMEEIRRYSAALPQLSVPAVELLIAHAKLVHSLWRLRSREVEADRARLADVRDRHTGCIRSLKSRCLRLLARNDAGA